MKVTELAKNINLTVGAAQVEVWNTRFGISPRIVKRTSDGRFLNNKSAKQLLSA